MKAVPRSHFRYVKAALPYSQGARAIATWMKDHANDLARPCGLSIRRPSKP